MAPHSNPNLSYLIVIEGGGFVQVGDERARVAAGEAVVWPRDVVHSVWTDITPMRAIVVEFATAEAVAEPLPIEGTTAAVAADSVPGMVAQDAPTTLRADGGLVPKPVGPPNERQSPEREPW
jgi:hypothetical protein